MRFARAADASKLQAVCIQSQQIKRQQDFNARKWSRTALAFIVYPRAATSHAAMCFCMNTLSGSFV
jgi:hypothetical protein